MSKLTKETKRRLMIIGGSSLLLIGGFYYYNKYHNTASKTSQCCSSKPAVSAPCCTSNKCDENKKQSGNDIKSIVNERYSYTARNFDKKLSVKQQKKAQSIAKVFGYTDDELAEIGEGNLGLSCGNPVRQAKLKKGETVLDLGCGAGMDMFLAKKFIGDTKNGGNVWGVDNSQDMLNKAIKNANKRKSKKKLDIENMKFMKSDIEDMKSVINDNTVDCVISNCVINLLPNKYNAFCEIRRILKPNGGRICLSDIALKKELPPFIKNDITAFVNCVGGAILANEYQNLLYKAGFKEVQMINKNVDLNVWKESWGTLTNPTSDKKASGGCCGPSDDKVSGGGCCGPVDDDANDVGCCGGIGKGYSDEEKQIMRKKLDEMDLNDYVASYYVFGYK